MTQPIYCQIDQTFSAIKLMKLLLIKIAFSVGCSKESLLLSNNASSIYCHSVQIPKVKAYQTSESISKKKRNTKPPPSAPLSSCAFNIIIVAKHHIYGYS